ncbi:MAG: hypothetical protein Q8Q33_08010 [Chlamydiota bacterium]|nr:hypothetical protein [Chlamydiota bacterium]
MTVNLLTDWLWNITGIMPPFCVEVILRDNTQYSLHSIYVRNDETDTAILCVWDFRTFNEAELEDLKKKLNQTQDRSELANEERLHPKLAVANLHIRNEDIWYCIEWQDRLWPEEERPSIGFK